MVLRIKDCYGKVREDGQVVVVIPRGPKHKQPVPPMFEAEPVEEEVEPVETEPTEADEEGVYSVTSIRDGSED